MAYATAATVAAISNIALADLDATLLTVADRHVENVLGYDMDGGVASRTQYFDMYANNDYYTNYNGIWVLPLDRQPLVSITSVTDDAQSSSPDVLSATGNPPDYWADTNIGAVKIRDDINLTQGQQSLKVIYTWGYAAVPDKVSHYADMYAAMLQELKKSPKSDSGYPLKEWEMGRYRELYDISNVSIKSKYSDLRDLLEEIEQEYKLWP